MKKLDGTIVTWNGSNQVDMVGFYMVQGAVNRNAFDNRVYLSPVGQSQINDYQNRGYTLTQSPGWN